MQGKSLIHRWRFIALGVMLCLLAAVFSFEAKIALYSPAGAHIGANKLERSDAPRLVSQALVVHKFVPSADPIFPVWQLEWLAVFGFLAAAMEFSRRADFGLAPVSISPAFPPFRFSRPPPNFQLP